MELNNLTPFDALSFTGYDKKDRAYHVVVMTAGYQLIPNRQRGFANDRGGRYDAILLTGKQAAKLCLADEYYGQALQSSVRRESDLAPFKPLCDLLLTGHAYSPKPSTTFEASLIVSCERNTIVNKRLKFSGDKHFKRTGGLGGSLREHVNPTRAYHLTAIEPTSAVPLRYEFAYGGSSVVADEKKPGEYLINDVCYRNPVGAGWMATGYLEALSQSKAGLPDQLPAPRITEAGHYIAHLSQSKPTGPIDAAAMAAISYPEQTVGFGPIGRSWAPRLAKAGHYDAQWLQKRHPYLPEDFDFAYWNCAPEDQQLPFPDPYKPYTIETSSLIPIGGEMALTLPPHRAVTLANLGGARLPLPMQVDTIEINTDTLSLRMVWRTAILKTWAPESLELRFETNPNAPLIPYRVLT